MSVSAPALQFVLSTYDINGTWLGLHNWTLQLQACGGSGRDAALWTRSAVYAVHGRFEHREHVGLNGPK